LSRKVIAVCGKGGVGKTTVSAVAAGILRGSDGLKSLIIDADHAGGLGIALGIHPDKSISDIRDQTINEIKKGETDKKGIALSMDYLLMEAAAERESLAFIWIGRPDHIGCYCSVNQLLRGAVELLAGQFDITLIDAEAGIEQVNRDVMRKVDYLLLVSDTSAKGIRVAETIRDVAGNVSRIDKVGLLLNRVSSEKQVEEISIRTGIEIIGWIPEDETIRRFDEQELSFFDLPGCPARRAITEALEKKEILKRL
jgi:CO dehydrogenase maturation factor